MLFDRRSHQTFPLFLSVSLVARWDLTVTITSCRLRLLSSSQRGHEETLRKHLLLIDLCSSYQQTGSRAMDKGLRRWRCRDSVNRRQASTPRGRGGQTRLSLRFNRAAAVLISFKGLVDTWGCGVLLWSVCVGVWAFFRPAVELQMSRQLARKASDLFKQTLYIYQRDWTRARPRPDH